MKTGNFIGSGDDRENWVSEAGADRAGSHSGGRGRDFLCARISEVLHHGSRRNYGLLHTAWCAFAWDQCDCRCVARAGGGRAPGGWIHDKIHRNSAGDRHGYGDSAVSFETRLFRPDGCRVRYTSPCIGNRTGDCGTGSVLSRSTRSGELSQIGIAPPGFRLPDDTHIDSVMLQVADLDRSIAYYKGILGMHVLHRSDDRAELGSEHDNRALIKLVQNPDAQPVP